MVRHRLSVATAQAFGTAEQRAARILKATYEWRHRLGRSTAAGVILIEVATRLLRPSPLHRAGEGPKQVDCECEKWLGAGAGAGLFWPTTREPTRRVNGRGLAHRRYLMDEQDRSSTVDLDDARAFVAQVSVSFTYAKSVPPAPHEYLVRAKLEPELQPGFDAFVALIARDGSRALLPLCQ